jgi:hypothetical protein
MPALMAETQGFKKEVWFKDENPGIQRQIFDGRADSQRSEDECPI